MASVEHYLFIEWMKWLQKNDPSHKFTYDGIIDMDSWSATPTKILLLLKDYNDTRSANKHHSLNQVDIDDREAIKTNVPNLRYHLANNIAKKKNWRTWNNAARWVYGLLNSSLGDYPPFSKAGAQGNSLNRELNMRKVAVVDIKKKPGTSSCTRRALDAYFAKHPEAYTFLARQISLYGCVNFIICCGDGIFDHCLRIIQDDKLRQKGYDIKIPAGRTAGRYVITEGDTIIINYRHPLLLQKDVSAESAYYELMDIVQNALKLKLNG